MKNRELKVKQRNPKYKHRVLKSTLGEMVAHPENAERIQSERSFRGKLVRNYIKRVEKLKKLRSKKLHSSKQK